MGKQRWKAGNMLNPAGCDRQCGGSESSAKHYYRGMGRNRLHQSADGFYFRPPIPLFL